MLEVCVNIAWLKSPKGGSARQEVTKERRGGKGSNNKSLFLCSNMDDFRVMMGMIENILSAGVDPTLTDIITEENVKHGEMLKNMIYFCSDPEPPKPETEMEAMAQTILSAGYDWSNDYTRGLLNGILIALISHDGEAADLFRLLEALTIENSV